MKTILKKYIYILLAILPFTLTSCEVVGGIFKAGMWFGILAVVFIVGIIFYLITRMGGSK